MLWRGGLSHPATCTFSAFLRLTRRSPSGEARSERPASGRESGKPTDSRPAVVGWESRFRGYDLDAEPGTVNPAAKRTCHRKFAD